MIPPTNFGQSIQHILIAEYLQLRIYFQKLHMIIPIEDHFENI